MNGNNSTALGASTSAIGANATAVGAAANATAAGATAVGENAVGSGVDSIAYGHNALANQSLSLAIGPYSSVTISNGVGIGANTSVTGSNSVALGTGSVASAANTVSVGAVGAERSITNVANGNVSLGSTDAVNGGQLFAATNSLSSTTSGMVTNFSTMNTRLANSFGGGSTLDANGVFTAPSYTVQGQTYNNVGGAVGALDSKVTTNTTAINTINTQIANGIGLVQQNPTTQAITVASTGGGNSVDFTGTAGVRKLTGLANGNVAAGSSDAVNGSQLASTNSLVSANTTAITTAGNNFITANQRIAAAFGGGSMVDGNGIVTAPSYTVQGTAYNNVGGAVTALDSKVSSNTLNIATNTTAITNLASQLGSAGLGLVTQNPLTQGLSVGATSGGTNVNLAGLAGARTLTGVLAGNVASGSTDAVNGAQLASTNTQVTANTTAITNAVSNALTANQRIASVFGGGSTVDANGNVTAPSYTIQGQTYTNLGGALGGLDSKVTLNTADIANLSAEINSGATGLVQQNSTTRKITIGAATDGTVIDATGTAGVRTLTGLAQGGLSSTSSDAVTGAQLFATNSQLSSNSIAISQNTSSIQTINNNISANYTQIAAALGGGSTVINNTITSPSYSVLGSTYNNVGSALSALSSQVNTNTININNIQNGGGGGGGGGGTTLSLVTQNQTTRNINVGSATDGTVINVAGTAGNRSITGLAAGNVSSTSTDAVNGAQLAATNAAVNSNSNYAQNLAAGTMSSLGGNASVASNGVVTNPSYVIQQGTFNNVGSALGAVDAAITATNNNLVNIINNATTKNPYSNVNSTGTAASASGEDAIAYGESTVASGSKAIAIGANSLASQTNAIAMGNTAQATGVNAIAIGTGAIATGSVAVGVNSRASNGGAALGDNTTAIAAGSAAVGPSSTATGTNSVAIGYGSVASDNNVISVGSATNTRVIQNVSAGVAPTDAVNVSQLAGVSNNLQGQINNLQGNIQQLQQDDRRNAGGVAMAMALAGNALPDGKKFGVALGAGTFAGQYALGVSSFVRLSDNIVMTGGVAFQDRQVGARTGIMAAW